MIIGRTAWPVEGLENSYVWNHGWSLESGIAQAG